MAASIITSIGSSNQPVRITKLRELYENLKVASQPSQVVGLGSNPVAGSGGFLATITSTTYTDIPSFSVVINSSGRRIMVIAPANYQFTGATSAAAAEIAVNIDGVIDATSIQRFSQPATGANNLSYGMFQYQHILAIQSAGQHTIKLQAKILSGTGAPTLYIYTMALSRMIVRDY